jgi:hypothetical protein
MRLSASKSEEKRLYRAVQNAVYQANNKDKPLVTSRKRTQASGRMPRHWHGVPKKLDLCAKSSQDKRERPLLGEYPFKGYFSACKNERFRTYEVAIQNNLKYEKV